MAEVEVIVERDGGMTVRVRTVAGEDPACLTLQKLKAGLKGTGVETDGGTDIAVQSGQQAHVHAHGHGHDH